MSTSTPSAPSPYDFGELLIDGRWRAGAAGTIFKDLDPYTGRTLVEVPQANVADIDAAYQNAGVLSAKLVKNSTLKLYDGYPHGMCATNPDVINADLLAFFKA